MDVDMEDKLHDWCL